MLHFHRNVVSVKNTFLHYLDSSFLPHTITSHQPKNIKCFPAILQPLCWHSTNRGSRPCSWLIVMLFSTWNKMENDALGLSFHFSDIFWLFKKNGSFLMKLPLKWFSFSNLIQPPGTSYTYSKETTLFIILSQVFTLIFLCIIL